MELVECWFEVVEIVVECLVDGDCVCVVDECV